ncbi:MAG TPA: hypothetical protein DD624_06460 [Alphaproteobacteria bacterium]|nr:hypothetical protein [Alphaproteobacteria bacterium]
MEQTLIEIQKTNLEILEKINELSDKLDSNSATFQFFDKAIYILCAFLILFVIVKCKAVVSYIKSVLSSTIQTNEKITDKFYELIWKNLGTLLSEEYSSDEIQKVINSLKTNEKFPINDIYEIGYVVKKENSAYVKINVSVILKKEGQFIKKTHENMLDMDFLPKSLMSALVKDSSHQTHVEMYKRG